MPEIGDIKKGTELGFNDLHKFVYASCPSCGKERWVRKQYLQRINKNPRCVNCNSKSLNYKGGITISRGYKHILISSNDFYFPMARANCKSSGYVAEHRLVMAKHLGRCLHTWELVHHKNGDKLDNRIENLQLVNEMQHNSITKIEKKIKGLQKQIDKLKLENKLLRWHIKELRGVNKEVPNFTL